MAASKGSTGNSILTEADGRQLAIDMLDEMSAIGTDELSIDGAEHRKGRPQNDILTRYLRNAQGSPAVEKGFLAVLTDIIGSAVECSGGSDISNIIASMGHPGE